MRGSVLSQRYAEALADVADKEGQLETVRSELLALADALSARRGFAILVGTAAKSREEKKALFGRISEDLNLSAQTARLLQYLVEKKRTALLPRLAASFTDEADRRLGICRAVVISAAPLNELQRNRIVERLELVTGAKIELEQQVDDSLMAGFQVRLEGKFFDGSARGQLARIRETIAHGG